MPIIEAVSKDTTISVGEGALYSVVAIVVVFAILLIIIGITTLVFKLTGLFALKAELDAAKKGAVAQEAVPSSPKEVVIEDDDMMAAVLVATIDYRASHKGDVRVVSVKEIK
ncbi:MAG: OadG family protein [Bacilli bacterium]|nr:OadG family protein [Bacilli bacterium]